MKQAKLVTMSRGVAAALCVSALTATSAIAAPFQNGSFETGTLTNTGTFDSLAAGSTAITGWTVVGQGVDYMGGAWVGADGAREIDLLSCGTSGGVAQSFDTVPGALYNVSFSMAGNPDGGIKTITATAAAATANFTFNTAGFSASNMGWATRSFQFTATGASTTLTILGGIQGGGSSCAGSALDNVSVTLLASSQVGVPLGGAPWAALALLIVGGMALRKRA
jgi:choice-of-anchor C domain-containing protein